jgi:pilus biogenesis lipoprotein CpaD
MSGDQRVTQDKSVAAPARCKARLLAIGIGMLGLVLAGCGTTAPPGPQGPVDLGDYQAAPRDLVQVEGYSDSHPVRLGQGGFIGKPERDRLTAYIADVAKNRPESLRVVLRGPATPAQLRQLGDLLVADGVDPRHIRADRWSGPRAQRGAIIVAVERAIAVLPDCPGWISHVSAPEDNLTNPNFGCSDVSNFAAMVGDPHHLKQGASSIYTDGERAASSVADYRADKLNTRELRKVNETFTVK